jgi:tetratricopeptide repeat protein
MGTPANVDSPVSPSSSTPPDLRQKQIARGRVLKQSAIAVFVIGIIFFNLFPYLVRIPAGYVIFFNIIWIALVIGVYVGATKLLLRGKKMMSASVEELLKADPRRPVLYLRSFLDDHAASKLLSGIQTPWAVIFGEVETEEEMLAKILSDFGPLICIGKPGEEYPELGASRMYVTQEKWHEKVKDLLARASIVVLRLGQTEGFWWELEHSIQELNPRALLIFVPYISDKTARDKIRQRAETLCPKPLPAFAGWEKKGGTVGSLRGIIFFDLDWTGHYVDLTRRAWTWKTLPRFLGFAKPRATVRYALRPLYQQAGVTWKEPPVRWLPTIYIGSVAGILALGIIALLLFSGFHLLQDWLHRHRDVATNVIDPSVDPNKLHLTPAHEINAPVRSSGIKSVNCIQQPTKFMGDMTPAELLQFSQGFTDNFTPGRDINCIAIVDQPVARQKVEWRWIAENVNGFSPNEMVLKQVSTVGSEAEPDTLRKTITIAPPGNYRLELYFGDANAPAKSLSFTVRPPSETPTKENENTHSLKETKPLKPRNTDNGRTDASNGLATAHFNRGVTLQHQGQLRAAVAEYVASIAIDPSNARAHGNLAVALDAMGNNAAAIIEYRTALNLNPNYSLAHYNLGLSLGRHGNRTQALVEYRAACSLEPSNELYCSAFRAAQSGAH